MPNKLPAPAQRVFVAQRATSGLLVWRALEKFYELH